MKKETKEAIKLGITATCWTYLAIIIVKSLTIITINEQTLAIALTTGILITMMSITGTHIEEKNRKNEEKKENKKVQNAKHNNNNKHD